VGDRLYGGSVVVEGSGEMLVTACGDNSALGRIISAVQEAQVLYYFITYGFYMHFNIDKCSSSYFISKKTKINSFYIADIRQ
jgi:magnesium-transporting ATPase (P-type)